MGERRYKVKQIIGNGEYCILILSDPRIVVPKRIEWLGWTLNFGQPVSIIIIGGILVFITVSMLYAPSK